MSKNYKANLELNVGFVTDAKKLVKNLETDLKQMDLTSSLAKPMQTNLTKSFKEVYSTLDKMGESLGKKGFNSKQYTTLFTSFNTQISGAIKNFEGLDKEMSKVFNSQENKAAIKDLEKYKDILKEISAILSKQQASSTRANTSKNKLAELGIDLDNKYTNKVIKSIVERKKSGNTKLTGTQMDVLGKNANPDKLKRVIDLYQQYESHLQKVAEHTKEIQDLKLKNQPLDLGYYHGK